MQRRYGAKEREQLVETVRTSGEPVAAVARRMGVGVSTAYLWMKGAPAAKVEFARLVATAREARAAVVIVEVAGAAIRVERGFDAELLLEVVSVLGRRSA